MRHESWLAREILLGLRNHPKFKNEEGRARFEMTGFAAHDRLEYRHNDRHKSCESMGTFAECAVGFGFRVWGS